MKDFLNGLESPDFVLKNDISKVVGFGQTDLVVLVYGDKFRIFRIFSGFYKHFHHCM